MKAKALGTLLCSTLYYNLTSLKLICLYFKNFMMKQLLPITTFNIKTQVISLIVKTYLWQFFIYKSHYAWNIFFLIWKIKFLILHKYVRIKYAVNISFCTSYMEKLRVQREFKTQGGAKRYWVSAYSLNCIRKNFWLSIRRVIILIGLKKAFNVTLNYRGPYLKI